MLAILFPALYEDIEYLIPADEREVQAALEPNHPVAGPSRLTI
jgi:hypothetical protein